MARGRKIALRSVTRPSISPTVVRHLAECGGHVWAPAAEEPEEVDGCPLEYAHGAVGPAIEAPRGGEPRGAARAAGRSGAGRRPPLSGILRHARLLCRPGRARGARGRPARGRPGGRGRGRLAAHPGRPRSDRRRAPALRGGARRAPALRGAGAAAPDLGPAGRPLRRVFPGLGHPAGRRRGGLRAEPGGGAQPPLPPLYVSLGHLERGGARGGAWRAPAFRGPPPPAWPPSLPPPVGLSSQLPRP